MGRADNSVSFNYNSLMNELKERISHMKGSSEEVESEGKHVKVKGERELEAMKEGKSDAKLEEESVVTEVKKKAVVHKASYVESNTNKVVNCGDNKDEYIINNKYSTLFPYPICYVSKSLPTPPTEYSLRKTSSDVCNKMRNKPTALEDFGIKRELDTMLKRRISTKCGNESRIDENLNDLSKHPNNVLSLKKEYRYKYDQAENKEYDDVRIYHNKCGNDGAILTGEIDCNDDNSNIGLSGACRIDTDLSKFERNFMTESQKLSATSSIRKLSVDEHKADSFVVKCEFYRNNNNVEYSENRGSKCCERNASKKCTKINGYGNHSDSGVNNLKQQNVNSRNNIGIKQNDSCLESSIHESSNKDNAENVHTLYCIENSKRKQEIKPVFTTRYYIMASKLRVIQ